LNLNYKRYLVLNYCAIEI